MILEITAKTYIPKSKFKVFVDKLKYRIEYMGGKLLAVHYRNKDLLIKVRFRESKHVEFPILTVIKDVFNMLSLPLLSPFKVKKIEEFKIDKFKLFVIIASILFLFFVLLLIYLSTR